MGVIVNSRPYSKDEKESSKIEKMKAVIFNKKGSPDKFVYSDVDKPMPNNKEILIKIEAVSLNAAFVGKSGNKHSILTKSIPELAINSLTSLIGLTIEVCK
jgi:hypothetical protein